MPHSVDELNAMANALEQSGDFRILRRLLPRALSGPPAEDCKIGVLLDFETTGLDTAKDEVIEIGMVKFTYSDVGEVTAVLDTFSSFNQPSDSIPVEITALTGISDEMVSVIGLTATRLPPLWRTLISSLLTMRPLTGSLPNVAGPHLQRNHGLVQCKKLSGESLALMVRG